MSNSEIQDIEEWKTDIQLSVQFFLVSLCSFFHLILIDFSIVRVLHITFDLLGVPCIYSEDIYISLDICDPFWENLPKHAETNIEIELKVGNNFILNKSLKPTFS